jgi:hypothetical protein
MALAGSVPRIGDKKWGEKEKLEHDYVVEFILQNLLNAGCTDIEKKGPQIIQAGDIEHMCTTFEAHGNFEQAVKLVVSMHPTPAVCGVPREEAFQIIKQTEKHPRLLYSGFLGIVSKQFFRLFVNLRCAKLDPTCMDIRRCWHYITIHSTAEWGLGLFEKLNYSQCFRKDRELFEKWRFLSMSFDKKNIDILISLMSQHGITHVVISPGSRNAPAIILFQKSGLFRIIPIANERSAGFFALGMAQYLQRTVALLSTSGTAVLNYSHAIAEAYYQKIPLLIITADRPEELIDQGDGQTIHQRQVFDNFIRKSFHLSPIHTELEERHRIRIVNEAIALTLYPVPGPIHNNLPLAEPLYDLPSIENVHHYPIIQFVEGKNYFRRCYNTKLAVIQS